ncbi:unnamed protein product [Caretta caretta]
MIPFPSDAQIPSSCGSAKGLQVFFEYMIVQLPLAPSHAFLLCSLALGPSARSTEGRFQRRTQSAPGGNERSFLPLHQGSLLAAEFVTSHFNKLNWCSSSSLGEEREECTWKGWNLCRMLPEEKLM